MKYSILSHIISLIFLFITLSSTAQNNVDSLENVLKEATGEQKITTLISLAKNYKRIAPQKTIDYSLQAYTLAKNLGKDSLIALSLAQAGDGELLIGNWNKAKIYYKQSFNIYNDLEDLQGLSNIYLDLGNLFFFTAVYDSAAFYYNKSLKFKKDLGNDAALINLYNNLGAVYKQTGKIDLAIEMLKESIKICDELHFNERKGLALINLSSIYFTQGRIAISMNRNLEALRLSEVTNDLYTKSNAYTNFGNIYAFLEDYENALDYNRKALEIDQGLKDWEGIITAYNNIGGIFLDQNNLDSAEHYFNKALSLHKTKDVRTDYQYTNYNLAKIFQSRKDYLSALKYLNQSLKISTENNDVIILFDDHIGFAEIYLEKDDLEKAEYHLKEALAIAQDHVLKNEHRVYKLFSALYQKKNLVKKAFDYHIRYTQLKDSLFDVKQSIAMAELNASYDLRKQQEEIRLLSDIKDTQKETIERQRTLKNILIPSSFAILILLALYILSFRNKIKANKILQEQNAQILAKNQEIRNKTESLSEINKELEKLNIAANQTDNAIIITNNHGKIEWINEGYTRLYGFTLEELLKERGTTYLQTSSNQDIEEIFKKILQEKKSQIYEADFTSKDGKVYQIHTTLTPVLNEQQEVVRLIAIDSDITKLKEVEKELQQLLVTKDKFFSIIAHDLKNPFNSMMGLAQLLVHGYDRLSPEKIKYFHKNLYLISKNGYELLINLLEWSRSQMGTINFKPIQINVCDLTEETFSLYKGKSIEKEITLTNSMSKDSLVYADQNMLKTIFRNLVSNALKFTERGGAIEVMENKLEGFKEIIIKDTGIGIEPDDIDKLFKLDKNFTSEGTEDEIGTGLGLLLCKEFVEKHGGKIRVESKVGFGSQFIFSLPEINKKPSA